MRFDYSCCGDSAGRSVDADLDRWVEDVVCAADELRRATGATQVALMGLRLGASIAVLAARRMPCRHLVLWDPVVDGADYLRELIIAHRAYMREELGEKWKDDLSIDANGFPLEALGTELPESLRNGIAAINLIRDVPQAPAVTLLCTKLTPAMSELRNVFQRIAGGRWLDITSGADWNSDAALNSATVPIDVVRAIVARIGEVNP